MSQEQFAQRVTQPKAFGQKSDTTFWIILSVGFALIGALGAAQWGAHDSTKKAVANPISGAQAQAQSASQVYRCNDGRVSFSPCG